MNISISSLRTAIQELEHAVEADTQPQTQGHKATGNELFADAGQKPVNFGSPSDPAKPATADPKSTADQADPLNQMMDVIMKAVMQFLQSLLQKGDASASHSSTGPASAAPAATHPSASAAPAQAPASGVSGNTALGGDNGLHLPPQLEPYRADIEQAASATGMPAKVIAAQIWAESRGNLGADTTNANGKTDAGLMQVNADTFAGLKKENPGLLGNADVNNPYDNIMAGALYLRDQSKAFGGDVGAGLRAYNSGPDKVNRNNLADTGGIGDPQYVANVLKFAQIIGSGQGQLPA
nr:transglycosylase SLT domain-containing protein [uncultured Pseudomonas sp.]